MLGLDCWVVGGLMESALIGADPSANKIAAHARTVGLKNAIRVPLESVLPEWIVNRDLLQRD
jgi:hypothetical protein